MKFILIVAVAILSVASASPYGGVKGHTRVIPKPEPIPEDVGASNKHEISVDQTSMMHINKQKEEKIQEHTTGIKMNDQEHITDQTTMMHINKQEEDKIQEQTTGSKMNDQKHITDQTSMMHINKQEEEKIQEQTSIKMTDQEHITEHKHTQTEKETDQKKNEEEQNYYHSFNKMDHTIETHEGESRISKEEQKMTDYKVDSSSPSESTIHEDEQSTKIEANVYGASSVNHHYAGVKGGRRHRHY